jgi:glutamate synthase (NADPH/NADH) large chain
MVELEAFTADPGSAAALAKQNGNVAVALESVMADMRSQDAERLHALIVRHAHYTNSAKAQLILSDWAAWLPKFKKIMPMEYRRALTEIAKAAAGADKARAQA